MSDILIDESRTQEPRALSEIREAEDLLFNQVWYDRKHLLIAAVEEGRVAIVDEECRPLEPQGDPARYLGGDG